MKKALAFIFLIVLQTSLFAANPVNDVMFVNGNVVDQKSHETLAGVEVRVKGTSVVAYTDFDGNFFLPEMPVDSYELEFHYITYQTSVLVTPNCSHCSTINVELPSQL